MVSSLRIAIAGLLAVSQLAAQGLSMEDIFIEGKYDPATFKSLGWIDGGAAYLTQRESADGPEFIRNDVATGAQTVLLSKSQVMGPGVPPGIELNTVALSPNETWALIGGASLKIWRRSFKTNYYLHNLATGETRPLTAWDDYQRVASFSPDGSSIAYVKDNNLHVVNLATGKTRALTSDGSFRVINGHADWVYEEEFSLTQAYAWSPDSKSLAFLRFDQWPGLDKPKTYPLVDEMTTYPTVFNLPYPKVGEKNSIMKLGVVNVAKGKPKWIDLGSDTDIYIPRITWTGRKNEVAFIRFNRRQNRKELLLADAKSRRSKVVATQTDEAWVDLTNDLKFLDGGKQFVWTDEKSGYRHIYLINSRSHAETAVTSGDWEVGRILAVNEDGRQILFTSKMDGSAEQQVYRVNFDGDDLVRMTGPGGWHTVDPSPDFAHYIHKAESINRPPTTSLKRADGSLVRWIIQNSLPGWDKVEVPTWELFNITTTDGTELRSKILRPSNFNADQSYPTLIYTYGGPGSQMVRDRWGESRGRDLWHRYLAQEGYVILTVDNRGTGGRGKAFKNLAYGDLGKWSLHDQIEAVKWVGRQSWGDQTRVGIWGWSGGAYLTALAMTSAAEIFKMGIAVSPVTDFRLYDTAWTERYLGLLSDNASAYEATSILSKLDGYRGNLLVVHGTGDDNVHAQHTWQLIKGLVDRNAEFDMQLYPNKDHGLPGVRYHLFSRMTRYIKLNL